MLDTEISKTFSPKGLNYGKKNKDSYFSFSQSKERFLWQENLQSNAEGKVFYFIVIHQWFLMIAE